MKRKGEGGNERREIERGKSSLIGVRSYKTCYQTTTIPRVSTNSCLTTRLPYIIYYAGTQSFNIFPCSIPIQASATYLTWAMYR